MPENSHQDPMVSGADAPDEVENPRFIPANSSPEATQA